MNGKFSLPLFGVIVALGLIISTYLVTEVVRDVRLSHQIIKVRGYAEKNVQSDLAVWSIWSQTRAKVITDGYGVLERNTSEILSFLKANGVQEAEIKTMSISIEERMKKEGYRETNELQDYLLKQGFEITSNNVQRVSQLSTKVDQLIKKGIELHSEHPKFYCSKVNELKSDLLTAATMDARNRANVLAEGSGVKLGFLRAARQGSFGIRSAKATNISSENYRDDEESIEKKITAVVTVDYSMK